MKKMQQRVRAALLRADTIRPYGMVRLSSEPVGRPLAAAVFSYTSRMILHIKNHREHLGGFLRLSKYEF